MAERSGFIVHFENFKYFERLSDAQLGELFRASCRYAADGAVPDFDDEIVDIIFEIVKDRIDRDAEKYEEKCMKNTENGRKGGRPKKTERFSEITQKTERFSGKPKKANSECDPKCDPDPDSVCECDPESACADDAPHTPHTAEELTVEWVLDFAAGRGYTWTADEAERFIAYNRDRGRRDGWDYAVDRWEQGRIKRTSAGTRSAEPSAVDTKANKYLQFVNRFKEDDHDAV